MPPSAPSTEVQLYRCHSCARQVFMKNIARGIGCTHCGSRRVRSAHPSFWLVVEYIIHNPGIIMTFWRENVAR